MTRSIEIDRVKNKVERIEGLLKSLRQSLEEAEKIRNEGNIYYAYGKSFGATEATCSSIQIYLSSIKEIVSEAEAPFETEVDVYLADAFLGKHTLIWDYDVYEGDDAIDELIVTPIKLELSQDLLPEWFRDGDFTALDWRVDLDIWYVGKNRSKRSPSIMPETVYIFEDPKQIIVEVKLSN